MALFLFSLCCLLFDIRATLSCLPYSRTGMPRAAMTSFVCRIVYSPK